MRGNPLRIVLLIGVVLSGTVGARGQQVAPQRLTLRDVIALALKKNLSVRVAGTRVSEQEGTSERSKASLFPKVSGDALANRQNVDLAAMGITLPEAPSVVGFSRYDFRVSATQSLIDRRAYHNWKATQRSLDQAKLNYQDARDLVIRQAAGLYLDGQAAAAEVQAAESRIKTSAALEKLARDQRAQGLATAVDVVRAQVQLERDRHTLLADRNTYETSLLSLAHFLGLSPGTPLELTDELKFHHTEAVDVTAVLPQALQARSDYRALAAERDSLTEQHKAWRARYLPTFSVNGDYGAIGPGLGSLAATGEVQGTLTFTFFDRDRTGEQKEISSRMRRLDEQIDDLGRQIEQDLRKALLDLESAENQVAVTENALNLAERELELAQDRFRNGVSDNIEVIQAQDTLASAQDDRIIALAQHADAAVALARALGGTETNYTVYLSEP